MVKHCGALVETAWTWLHSDPAAPIQTPAVPHLINDPPVLLAVWLLDQCQDVLVIFPVVDKDTWLQSISRPARTIWRFHSSAPAGDIVCV